MSIADLVAADQHVRDLEAERDALRASLREVLDHFTDSADYWVADAAPILSRARVLLGYLPADDLIPEKA